MLHADKVANNCEENVPMLPKNNGLITYPDDYHHTPWLMERDGYREYEEASKDPGLKNAVQLFEEKDFERHRAQSIYFGYSTPNDKERHSHHRRHRHHHRRQGSTGGDDRPLTPPSQRVQFILGEECDDDQHVVHPLFIEMEQLHMNNGDVEWRETARWIKFEEDVEEGGNRWSKPHVATLSLHSLFEVRSCIINGAVILDMEAQNLENIAELLVENWFNAGQLSFDNREKVKDILLRRHRHQHEKKPGSSSSVSKLPLIRSLAEIGRNYSTTKSATVMSGNHEEMVKSLSSYSMSSHFENNGCQEEPSKKSNLNFMRKIPHDAETSNILVGELEFLDKLLSAFIRLKEATLIGNLTEVPVPTKFIFVLLGPANQNGNIRYHEIGRAIATLMTDEIFQTVAYKAKSRKHILAGVDEFLDSVTVLPPGEWDPNTRIEPPSVIPSQEPRKHFEKVAVKIISEEKLEDAQRTEMGLVRSGRLFGGLINDVKRKSKWYWSDFKDAIALQSVAVWIFLYFACLAPIITFGGLLGDATKNRMAAIESLVSGFICGMLYGFFSGQPLTILGSTGPVLVFETILFDFCQRHELDYLAFRLWIGVWMFIVFMTLVAIDASYLVCYITRFTEENFATLIALIFIYQGLNGTLIGEGCSTPHYYPDIFLMSVLLFVGTFLISVFLKNYKNSLFFPNKVRVFISDFAVIIAIMSMSLVDYLMGVNTPKLHVPEEFKPTWHGREWLVHPFGRDVVNPWWTTVAAILPALLGTILIFMDQQITSVIINRKENKLKKGCGYHLDLLVLAILILICSFLGLPWFVAATVLSINHVDSLKLESDCAAPGEKPHFLGVREQRITHILIFITVGLSVVLTPLLKVSVKFRLGLINIEFWKHIPMPVLFGVFLYMGISSLKGLQLFDRILLMFIPVKYQPDYAFLRQVELRRVHLFTCIQISCLIILWLIKSFKTTSILFPVMLVVMIGVRKCLDFIFTARELKILDDIIPEITRRKLEEEKLSEIDEFGKISSVEFGSNRNVQITLPNGNILKFPATTINISEEMNRSGVWKQVNDSLDIPKRNNSSGAKK